MAELWLPLEPRRALWEPVADQLRVIGWRPGPAGVAAVDVAEGLRVVVDHAQPTTLTEVIVDLDDGRLPNDVAPLLASVVGERAAAVLADLPGRRPVDRPVALPADRRRSAAPTWAADFVRLALGADLGDDASRSPAARAVGLVEGALAALALHGPLGHHLARRSLDLLAATDLDDPGLAGAIGATVAARLAELAAELSDPLLAAAARRAAGRLDEGARSTADGRWHATADTVLVHSAMAAPMGAAIPSSPPAAPPGRTGRPVPVDGEHRAWAWLDGGNAVQVSASPAADGTWARVFRRHDRLLLGLAPVRDGRSLVVVPPTDPDDLVVDLTDRPAAPRPATTRLLLDDAVSAGRHAARLSRLGDPADDAAWAACADAWTRLGDVQRANLARRNGRREPDRDRSSRLGRAPAALVADRIG